MQMPGRTFNAGNQYRYGFNGKENDKDISEGGQDYGLRIYDSRLGKFLSVDPLTPKYPFFSPYQFAGNTPIQAIDLDGGEPLFHTTKTAAQASSIVEGGFNATMFGRLSAYNWFSTTPDNPTAGAAVTNSSGPTLKIEGINLKNVELISKVQTNNWTSQILKNLGLNEKSYAALEFGTKAERRRFQNLGVKIRGTLYNKIGEFMNGTKQSGYFLEADGTYAFTDAVANDATRTITGIQGEGAGEVLANSTRTAGTGEGVAASKAFAGTKGFSFLKWGGRALIAVAVAKDVYDIYQSDSRVRTTVIAASRWGGAWLGASAAASGYAATGADLAGPWGWAGHIAVTLGGGVAGAWAADKITTKAYDYFFKK